MTLRIGAQLWSLREILQKDPMGTLSLLSDVGYRYVEPAGFSVQDKTIQGFRPEDLKTMVETQGMSMPCGHFFFLPQEVHIVCECAAQMGMQYIVLPYLEDAYKLSKDTYKKAAEMLNEIGVIVNSYGLRLAYHNHAYEFEMLNQQHPFDILLENTDPNFVFFEMDMGWMEYAAQSPLSYFERYAHRFPLWHLRDLDAQTKNTTIIGKGIADFKGIFENQHQAGLEYAFIEMASGTTALLEKMIQSIRNLQQCLS